MRMITVLIAEDEKLIRAGICRLVDQFFASMPEWDAQILEAANGRDAYRKCLSGHVDILITDIKMPAMSGVALVRKLKSDGASMHVLAVSGHQDYEYVRAMMKLGVHDYLIKPISAKQLFEALTHFVDSIDTPGLPRATASAAPQPANPAPFLALAVQGGTREADVGPGAREDAFYDLAAPPDQSDAESKDALQQLAWLLLDATDGAQLKAGVERLFCCYVPRRASRAEIQRDISWLQYELMGKSAEFIEFISKNRFGRYDLTDCIDGATTLSDVRARVLEALQHLLGQVLERREAQTDHTLAQAKAFMQAHFPSNLQLRQVAEIVHLHPNYFSVLFSQKLGMTFREYLRKLRIDAAKNLMLTTTLPISEIAERVGYSDSAHFFRAFKSATGMTPKTFRRARNGQNT